MKDGELTSLKTETVQSMRIRKMYLARSLSHRAKQVAGGLLCLLYAAHDGGRAVRRNRGATLDECTADKK